MNLDVGMRFGSGSAIAIERVPGSCCSRPISSIILSGVNAEPAVVSRGATGEDNPVT
jgi:hypothetical protein